LDARWSSGITAANWTWFAAAVVVPNLLAVALLRLALRATSPRRLASLQQRALACLVLLALGIGVGVAHAGLQAYGIFSGGSSVDPSQRARVLAESIASIMNYAALGMVATPLPLASAIVIFVRRRRLEREVAPPAQPAQP
jgi:hypothetical protein